ncbi:MAG: HAD-IA family hydrolase [Magnetococcales bacterium]|nr:HAD-IA family hydrolase [Magnetococcales bacterium]
MTEPIPCRGVMFDLDGTLVDSSQDLWRALNHVLDKYGFSTLAHDQVKDLVGRGARSLIARGFWGAEAVAPKDDPRFEAAVDDFLVHYHAHIADHSRPYPGVRKTLELLGTRGLRLAVATNKPAYLTTRLLDLLDLSRHFDPIVSGDTFPRLKPDPLPLLEILGGWGIPPSLGVMVGDSETDAEAAHAAGSPLILVSYGYNRGIPVSTHAPRQVIHHFTDLGTLLLPQP